MFQARIATVTFLIMIGACAKMVQSDGRRIILVGQTRSGLSAAGNIIYGKEVFKNDFTYTGADDACQCEERESEDVEYISIVNTPGLLDSSESELKDIMECVLTHSFPGPHAFLLVINVKAQYTEEERATLKWIEDNFGPDASMYTILLFTHTDLLEDKTLDEFINENEHLRRLKHQCGGRYHAFNYDLQDRSQVSELLEKIDKMVKENGGQHYTNYMYRKAQRRLEEEKRKKQEEERIREKERRKKQKEEERRKKLKKDCTMMAMSALGLLAGGYFIPSYILAVGGAGAGLGVYYQDCIELIWNMNNQ